ncbi:hypothetical protein DQ04_04491040 [Trypanosoma grayi]|uniref:hypothetical protein n=1 Tax=Trypanosoma grayi TaxID=71804 RepID=UPI0004F452C8|nr:hypothetical protein DQ04_04491040 [Trypanosoma grayi]KEG09886.1 hypothetical protein DQ04_04491040 [Trypanosoma grayi]
MSPCARRCPLLRAAHVSLVRSPYGALYTWRRCVAAAAAATTTGSSSSSSSSSSNSNDEAHPSSSKFSIDPRRLPDTIPGVSREELAARLEKYQRELAYKAAQATSRELANEIDTMRRAMPPEQFRKFLHDLDAIEAKNAKEAARINAMSPSQLYRYQQRQHRRQWFRRFAKTLMLCVTFFGAIFFMFFLFFFFQ